MSSKGQEKDKKHGRPHNNTHATTLYLNQGLISTGIDGKPVYLGIESLGEDIEGIQDGGHDVGSAGSKYDQQLGEILPSGSSIDSQDYSGVRQGQESILTLTGHNLVSSEWVRSKLQSVSGVCVVGGDDVKGIGALFGLTTDNSDVGEDQGGTTLGEDVDRTDNLNMSETTLNKDKMELNVVNLSSTLMGIEGHEGLQHVKVGDNGCNKGLSEAERACLEEIEKGSQLSPEEKELLENSRKEFQALEFPCLNNDKSNTLMTPQELELMPERGREFEESVGPKEDLTRPLTPAIMGKINKKDNTQIVQMQPQVKTLQLTQAKTVNPQLTMSQPLNIANLTGTNINGNILTTVNNPLTVDPGSLTLSSVVSKEMIGNTLIQTVQPTAYTTTLPSDSAETDDTQGMATVSIATDNSANFTKILVNTPQGQQIFQINTAELNRAANTVQPLTIQGGVVDQDNTGKVLSSTALNGITVEDGYLVIPVSGAEQEELEGDDHVNSLMEGVEEEEEDSTGEDVPSVPGRAWMCQSDGCNRIFTKLSKLKVHLMRHTGERPFRCSMPDCDWAFTTAYKLKRHEESHQKKKDFTCDFAGCGRRFTTIYNLNTHRKLHERPCTQECPECGIKFPTIRKLDLHMKNHIGAQKTYKCPVEGCNKMFFSPLCMGSHTRVHQEDRDLTCHFWGCGKVYDKLCRLKQHMRTHTGEKPYICDMSGCGWAFSTASKLKRHQRKHTGERRWVCPIESCGKAFMRAEHLKGHLVTHSGERPFVCQVEGCGARFTAKSSMYVHIKKHNEAGKKGQYPCPLDGCIRMLPSKSSLRTHIAKHYQAALAQANTGDLNSIIPILSPDDIQEGLEGLLASQNEEAGSSSTSTPASSTTPTPQHPILTSVNSLLTSTDTTATIDQAELLQLNDTSRLGGEAGGTEADLDSSTSVPNSMVAQLILSSSLAEGHMMASQSSTSTSPITSDAGLTEPVRLLLKQAQSNILNNAASVSTPVTDPSPAIFSQELDTSPMLEPLTVGSGGGGGGVGSGGGGGSARTDYHSNHLLIDRAKKKRKFLKGSLDSSESGSTIDLSSIQDLGESSKTSFTTDGLVSSSAGDAFVDSELLSSSSITFRDPETGAIYVQTQLLQDDPPTSDLYQDSGSLDVTGQGSLTHELPADIFQDSTEGEESSFSGSTINLQDLA